jgi:hypothetical protein
MSYSVVKKASDHFYQNIYIANPSNVPIKATFNERRDFPILDNPSEYELSVIRFTIPGSSIPIFAFKNNTYIVSFRYYDGVTHRNFEQYVAYIPPTLVNIIPTFSANQQYVYSYNAFIQMINAAIVVAFNDLKTTFPALGVTKPPFFSYDNVSYMITFWYESAFLGSNIQFFISDLLAETFESFNYTVDMIIDSPSGIPGGQPDPPIAVDPTPTQRYAYSIPFQDLGVNYSPNIFAPGSGAVSYAGYNTVQEFPCLYRWNEARGISIVSANIPVQPDQYSTTLTQSLPVSFKLITDFEFDITKGPETRSNIYYVPTAEYRMIDLTDTTPLRVFDLNIFWVDNFGRYNQLYLFPSDSVSIKIMYRKKQQHVKL